MIDDDIDHQAERRSQLVALAGVGSSQWAQPSMSAGQALHPALEWSGMSEPPGTAFAALHRVKRPAAATACERAALAAKAACAEEAARATALRAALAVWTPALAS